MITMMLMVGLGALLVGRYVIPSKRKTPSLIDNVGVAIQTLHSTYRDPAYYNVQIDWDDGSVEKHRVKNINELPPKARAMVIKKLDPKYDWFMRFMDGYDAVDDVKEQNDFAKQASEAPASTLKAVRLSHDLRQRTRTLEPLEASLPVISDPPVRIDE